MITDLRDGSYLNYIHPDDREAMVKDHIKAATKGPRDGTIVYAKQKGIDYSGRTVEDLQQKGRIDLIHPDNVRKP